MTDRADIADSTLISSRCDQCHYTRFPPNTGIGLRSHWSGSLKRQILTLTHAVQGHVVDVHPDDHQVSQNVIDGRVGLHTGEAKQDLLQRTVHSMETEKLNRINNLSFQTVGRLMICSQTIGAPT